MDPEIDISKILLPKKDPPPSSIRINAGVLLEQETTVKQAGFGYADLPAGKSAEVASSSLGKPPTPAVLPSVAEKPKEGVKQLQTYRGDIEAVVKGENVSVVTIAAAEAQARSAKAAGTGQANPFAAKESASGEGKTIAFKIAMVVGGVMLLSIAGGVLYYIFSQPTTAPVAEQPAAPFIFVDHTTTITVPTPLARRTLIASLQSARDGVRLSLGLIERLVPENLDAQTLLVTLAPQIPQDFLRIVDPKNYLLGVHSYDENQPLLILSVDSYNAGYSGMFAWEYTMQNDLAPLFTRTPAPRIPSPSINSGPSSDSATSTPQAGFVDKIVNNRDSRVVLNQSGDILLLWTFLDRNTIVITTNEGTLREVIVRARTAPVLPQP